MLLALVVAWKLWMSMAVAASIEKASGTCMYGDELGICEPLRQTLALATHKAAN